jgi:hypothetical protein
MLTGKQQYLRLKHKRVFKENTYKVKKSVTFNNQVYVREIPSRKDLFAENLIKEIWYTPLEYKLFRTIFFYD